MHLVKDFLTPTIVRIAASIAIALTCQVARAQHVYQRTENYGLDMNSIKAHARRLDIADYPDLAAGETGTVIDVQSAYNDADISVFSSNEPSMAQLIAACKNAASDLGFPLADYRVKAGAHTLFVDIEVNKYVDRTTPTHRIAFDLSRVRRAFEADGTFRKPIFVHIDGETAEHSELTLGGAPSQLGEYRLLHLSDVPSESRITYATHVTWLTYVIGGTLITFMGSLFLLLVVLPWTVFPKMTRKHNEKLAKLVLEAGKPSPEQVQLEYDKSRPRVWASFIPLAAVPVMLVMFPLVKNGSRALTWLGVHEPFSIRFMPFLMVGIVANMLVAKKVTDMIAKRKGVPAPPKPQEADMFSSLAPAILIVFGLLGIEVLLFNYVPALRSVGTNVRLACFMGPAILLPIVIFVFSRKSRKALLPVPYKPGDPLYDAALAMAAKVGVRVRKVSRSPNKMANASASIFGTVTVTEGLLEGLDDQEVTAVLAHEIGHLRHNHVRRNFAISLGVTLLALYGQFWLIDHTKHLGVEWHALLSSPLFGMFLLPLCMSLLMGPARRKAELEADRFALEETRDPTLVIRALTKVHDINQSPHRLKNVDELFASHPSLERRVASLRTISQELGLAVPVEVQSTSSDSANSV